MKILNFKRTRNYFTYWKNDKIFLYEISQSNEKIIFNVNYSLIIDKDNIEIDVYKIKKWENYFFATYKFI